MSTVWDPHEQHRGKTGSCKTDTTEIRMEEKMVELKVVEHFISINGEGRKAGQLAHFVRFAGCNLACRYCDTRWANAADVPYESMGAGQIYELLQKAGICNVTLTGGEPLLQEGIGELLDLLRREICFSVEVETNGAVELTPFLPDTGQDNVSFTMDYKLAGSGMEQKMLLSNYAHLRSCDTVKFVVGSVEEMIRCKEIMDRFHLIERGCGIFISPCFGQIDPAELVDYMAEQKWNHVNLQLQLHKLIWDPDQRGV